MRIHRLAQHKGVDGIGFFGHIHIGKLLGVHGFAYGVSASDDCIDIGGVHVEWVQAVGLPFLEGLQCLVVLRVFGVIGTHHIPAAAIHKNHRRVELEQRFFIQLEVGACIGFELFRQVVYPCPIKRGIVLLCAFYAMCAALAYAAQLAPTLPRDKVLLVNLSGRGDKDINTVAQLTGLTL